jgi:hypothetical protein
MLKGEFGNFVVSRRFFLRGHIYTMQSNKTGEWNVKCKWLMVAAFCFLGSGAFG